MRRSMVAMCAGLFGFSVALQASAQAKPSAAIPATAPTSAMSVSDLPSAHPAVEETPRGESHVTWTGSALSVDGGGDDLRNILVQVMRETGMKVMGGIPDERVFGKYGPGPVQQVLAELFDGLSINMLLLNDSPTQPKELILTARSGATTPPMTRPIAEEEGRRQRRDSFRQGLNAVPSGNVPQQQPSPAATVPPSQNPVNPTGTANPASANDAATPAATSGSDTTAQPDSPNGPRTPEQIFQELRKRQQQQQQSGSKPQ